MRNVSAVLFVVLLIAPAVSAQSQAANGSIEGTVTDMSGGVLPGVTVTVTHLGTGAARSIVTNENGFYRVPLLPLGTYRVVAELQGFKKFEESDVVLAAGQTASINVALGVGTVTETVTVSANERPPLEAARIDGGHNLTPLEVKSLPQVSRNPYNFALAQPGVTGFENPEFGVPRISANGTLLRVNYQIDGNTNTEKDRAGLRLLPISEVFVQEVKVVTSGYAPEFGQTMGLVYNAITPAGSNQIHGDASYLFRRDKFSAFPFFFTKPHTDENLPKTKIDTVTGAIGGPAIRNKLFYYVGYERTARDLSGQSAFVITIKPEDAALLGLPPQPGAIPASQAAKFFIGRGDYQMGSTSRITIRHLMFRNDSPNNSGGGLQSLDLATNFLDSMNSTAGQFVTAVQHNMLNEFRAQYANRHQMNSRNENSGTGPAIVIPNVATFGSPLTGTGQNNAGFEFTQNILQVIDNFTMIRSNHSYKFGVDAQFVHDDRVAAPATVYTFPSSAAYLAAKNGLNPFTYTTFSQLSGNLTLSMDSSLYGLFVQDDWQVSPSLKVLYGVRYDLYRYPDADPGALFPYSQHFAIDRNNVGPRAGFAYAAGDRTVVRGSSGVLYDQAILVAYENALTFGGSPRNFSVTINPTSQGALPFPATLANLPPGFVAPVQSSIYTIDPAFRVARTWQSNVQLERAVGLDYTVAVGFTYALGSGLPVASDINLIGPTGTLADGRPVYNTDVSAATRLDPRFNHIYAIQSLGDSHYKGLTLQINKRASHGVLLNLSYTLGKGTDNAPVPAVSGLGSSFAVVSDTVRSDPTSLDRDLGPNLLDMRHNFNGTIVLTPHVTRGGGWAEALMNNNEIGILLQLNSGFPVNIRSTRDLNNDGQSNNDRPLFVDRNSLYLPNRYNMDLRYSRVVPIRGSVRADVVAELKNVFNNEQVQGVTTAVATDAAGTPLAPIPTDPLAFPGPTGFEQREFQLGFRVRF